jgi:hypothetical protein
MTVRLSMAILFLWKLSLIQDQLEAVRDNLRGFSGRRSMRIWGMTFASKTARKAIEHEERTSDKERQAEHLGYLSSSQRMVHEISPIYAYQRVGDLASADSVA